MTYVIIWEFRIKPQAEAEFVRQYGPDGSWARLFRGSNSYIRTELVRDVAEHLRFVTLDYWRTEEEFASFRRQNVAEYERLDRELEGLTKKETRLGAFRIERSLRAES
jgi:heme-degrading monooxygenase HmoA